MPESPDAGRRLLWIHQNFVSARQTGISRAVYFLSALLDAGWTVDVVCSRTGYLDEALDADLSDTVVEQDGGLTLHRLGHPPGIATQDPRHRGKSYFSFNQRALRYVRQTLPRPDMIWSSSPPATITLPAMALAIPQGIPMLLEVRDVWPEVLIQGGLVRNPLVIAVMEWFEVFTLQFADHIIPVAPGFQALYERMGIAPSRMTTNPTGGDPYFLGATAESGAAWRREQGLEGQFLALFSGSMNETSNVDLLAEAALKAAGELPQVTWLFAGSGRLVDAVRAAAQTHDTIRYLGALPRDAMRPIFAAADVGIISRAPIPVEQLVYPGKLFDYLASGLPVLTNHIGQPSVVVDEADCGVVLRGPRTAASFVQGIRQLLELPSEERVAMGARGQNWLLREMNAFQMGEELAALVNRGWPRRSFAAQLARAVRAGAIATCWTLAGRQRHARAPFSGTDAEALIRAAHHTWQARTAISPARQPDFQLPVPSILSARE